MVSSKSFYLLEQLQTYPAVDAQAWLGRVVSDFRRPVAAYTPPTDSSSSFKYHIDPEFTNVDGVLSSLASDTVKFSLLELFGISNEDTKSRKHSFKSRKVARYRIHQDNDVFKQVLKDPQVASDLMEWGFNVIRPLYFIVGFLVTDQVEFTTERTKKRAIDGNIDPVKIPVLAAGFPVASILPSSTIGAEHARTQEESLTTTVKGSRIFAIEYRSFRKRLIGNAEKGADLKKYGPQGDRTFSDADTETESLIHEEISLDIEDFSEIVETEATDQDIEKCFSLDDRTDD